MTLDVTFSAVTSVVLLPERSVIGAAIDALGDLPVGWSYGRGIPIPIDVRTYAKKLAAFGERQGFLVYASPGVEGEVILDFYRGGYALEVYVKSDQMYDAAVTKTVGYDVNVLYDKSDRAVVEIHKLLLGWLWNDTTFDLSTLGTISPAKESTAVKLSVSLRTGGSLSWHGTVQRRSQIPFVLT